MKHLILVILIGTLSHGYCQVNNYAKNSAKSAELDSIYKEELNANPNSVLPYLNHANRLAELTYNARKNAPEFYLKALEIDSTYIEIYIDFGNYLLNNGDLENAYFCFNKGLEFQPENEILIENISKVEKTMRQNEEYWELHKLPQYIPSDLNSDMTFREKTDYDKLFKETREGKYSFKNLVTVFESNPVDLTDKEMFYLMLGRSQQKNYSPYNYDDELKMQELTKTDIIKAIEFGEYIIENEPLNLLILRELLYCYRKENQKDKIVKTEAKIEKIFLGILYSGDGTCEQPFLTLSVQEEYPFCIYLGYNPVKVISSKVMCSDQISDKMLVRTYDEKDKYIYFNYSPIFIWTQNKIKE